MIRTPQRKTIKSGVSETYFSHYSTLNQVRSRLYITQVANWCLLILNQHRACVLLLNCNAFNQTFFDETWPPLPLSVALTLANITDWSVYVSSAWILEGVGGGGSWNLFPWKVYIEWGVKKTLPQILKNIDTGKAKIQYEPRTSCHTRKQWWKNARILSKWLRRVAN